MEESIIKLSLEKAKEWYQKGGELKEVALQAFKEKELISVNSPTTWEEYCHNNGGCTDYGFNTVAEANAFYALWKLIQLRDEYWRLDDNWKPDLKYNTSKFAIYCYSNEIKTNTVSYANCILTFRTKDLRDEFYKNFRELIEKAKMFL